ncbi:MAG: rRNA maturation RNase YbeY [Candidatus Kapabacteria bacterium]|jgi:rRNA maturation RNase YbeY|nr:rRNA maturation RNase YbeY [Candidatus Kapabacteria bacterium]
MKFEIHIFNDTERKPIPKAKMQRVVENVLRGEKWRGKPIQSASVSIVLVNDAKIHAMNKEFLQHDYPTDIITFPLEEETIDGELYISLDTATRQAEEHGVSLTNELMRLAAHGTLHLVGYDDASTEERKEMSRLEDTYIRH